MSCANRLSGLIGLFCFTVFSCVASAAEPQGPPIPAAEVGAKVCLFQLKLAERSPQSKISDVAARMGVKNLFDYKLSNELFTAYVPKSAGPDGKYGLMVSLHFREYGYPAPAWTDVLEKYHIVWIGAQNSEDGRDTSMRIGLMLDAAYNGQKLWKVDERRLYACVSSPHIPDCSVDLEYPDIFQGGLHSLGWAWIGDIPNSTKKGSRWAGPHIRKPDPALWNLARQRSRFYIADRSSEYPPEKGDPNKDIATEGFLKSGFKYVKAVSLDPAKIDHYAFYTADWFEEGVQFLDAPLTDPDFGKPASAKPDQGKPDPGKVAASPKTSAPPPADAAPKPASPPPAPIDEKAVAADRALSLAKSYLAAQNYAGARSRLEKLIEAYPNTPAAKEAKGILQDIQGK
ncbi:MAG TPA: tetratricopeptide repeat protein [Tepidisphaeraceae bacterium]|jgi:hypothetical protein